MYARHLKRIFKDLFERQGFEDDGIFDWDILKKQKEQGAAGGFVGGAGGGVGDDNEVDNEGNSVEKKAMLESGYEGNAAASNTSSPRGQITAGGRSGGLAG